MTILLQNAVFGLLIGGLYGLGAVGLSLVFGVLAVLNVAHGELIMLGGYVSVWLFTLWRGEPFVSVPGAGSGLLLGGGGPLRVVFSPLASSLGGGRGNKSVLLAFGLSLGLQT